MLKTKFLRDNRHRIIGTVVSGYQDGSQIVRNWHGQVVGRVVPNAAGTGISKDQHNHIRRLDADKGFYFGFSEDSDE